MNASRAALMVVGVNLVAVWAAAAAGSRTAVAEPAAPPQVMADEAVGEARASLLAAAERLEAHARRHVAPSMTRDPFRFGAESRPAGRRAPDAPAAAPPAEEPAAETTVVDPEPDIVLQGMAESADGEGSSAPRSSAPGANSCWPRSACGSRTGTTSWRVTADSVELEDTVRHVRRTWRLK